MAITVMGGGTKTTTEDVNLDPQKQFWSFLSAFAPDTTGKIAGFPVQQTTPAGLSVQVGGGATDSAIMTIDGRKYLLSTDGEAVEVALETAPSANSRIDAIVTYLDFSDPDASSETAGTPEYVKTIAVAGTVASSPSAPTDAEIQAALPAQANGVYIQWGTVAVGTGATQVVDSDITESDITVAASKDAVNEVAEDITALNNDGVVKSHNIDFTTFGSGLISSVNRESVSFNKTGYVTSNTSSWHGINYDAMSNYLGDLGTADKGSSYAAGAKGGPITLSSTFPEGLYLLCWVFQGDTIVSNHTPFRSCIERDGATVFTSADISAAAGAGSGSTTIAFWLKPGDVIYSQIFGGASLTVSFRHWFYLNKIFSLSS